MHIVQTNTDVGTGLFSYIFEWAMCGICVPQLNKIQNITCQYNIKNITF